MKVKVLALVLMLFAAIATSNAADQWEKDEPAGTQNVSDIDTLVGANNEAIASICSLRKCLYSTQGDIYFFFIVNS